MLIWKEMVFVDPSLNPLPTALSHWKAYTSVPMRPCRMLPVPRGKLAPISFIHAALVLLGTVVMKKLADARIWVAVTAVWLPAPTQPLVHMLICVKGLPM